MPNYIGLYLEDSTFHLAQISGRYHRFKVTKYVKVPFESKEEGFLRLEKAWKEGKFKGKLCVGLPFTNCIFRTFTVPYGEKQKVAQVVRYETENHVHPHTAEELMIEHEILSVVEKNSKVAVHALLKNTLEETLQSLQKISLSPDIVTTDALALYYAGIESAEFFQKLHTLLILPGKKQFRLVTITDHKITQLRTLRFGYEEEGYQERLIREIQKSFVTVHEPLEQIGILGNSAVATAMNTAQESVGCPTILVNPTLETSPHIDRESLLEVGWIPVFLARANFKKDAFQVNFRKGVYSKDTPFSIFRIPLFFCFLWFVVLCLGLGFHFYFLAQKTTPHLNQINTTAREFMARYHINMPEVSEDQFAFRVKTGLQGKLEEMVYGEISGPRYNFVPIFKIWNQVFQRIDTVYKNFGFLRFEQFTLNQNRFFVKGRITASSEVEELIRAFQTIENFSEVSLEGRIELIQELNLLRFQIKAQVRPQK